MPAPADSENPVVRSRRGHRFAYLLAFAPLLTDWIDTGHIPHNPREYVTEIVMGLLILLGLARLDRDANRLRELSETDPLTGLRNRRSFRGDLETALARSRRLGERFALAYVDVDRFKSFNDRFGHDVGDDVLRLVAKSLSAAVRQRVDGCYRLGGDELALILSGTDAAGALAAASRALAAADVPERLRPLTCSVGAVEAADDVDADALVRKADARMYAAKRGGATDEPGGSFRRIGVGKG